MDMKYKAHLVLHVVSILLFKKCLLWAHLNLKRKCLEVIKCVYAHPDWLTDWLWERSGKGVSGLTENKGGCWSPCSYKSAQILYYAISASTQHGSSLRKCTQSIRLMMCRPRGGGTLNWQGINRYNCTRAENCSDILASISESQREMQSSSTAK